MMQAPPGGRNPAWLCILAVVLRAPSSGRGDYPPHELEYRLHPIDLYPKEAAQSRLCLSRDDGDYPNDELDLGDPRCTFIMCTNQRTVVHSCPSGTRTGRFYLPELEPQAFRLAHKYGKYTKYGSQSRSLVQRFRDDFRNHKSTHGVCDYFDLGGVCGRSFPDYNAFLHEEQVDTT